MTKNKIYKVGIINLTNEKRCKMSKKDNFIFGFGITFGIIGIAFLIIGIQLLIRSGFSKSIFLTVGIILGVCGAVLVGISLALLKNFFYD